MTTYQPFSARTCSIALALAVGLHATQIVGRQPVSGDSRGSDHWSFQPIHPVPLPTVRHTDWPKNEIDYFILARLQREGLTPSAPADRERVIRRLRFDLTGLPPTLEEIDAFLYDASPNAVENLVDRLLSHQQFGERMASDWLDVARYSDSYGYQVDRDRFVWPWRDWVVKAFNENLPYDQFVTWQLAGDLLPAATDEQILATTFNRLHPQKVEGGSVPEEFRVEYVADRNHTFGTAFLGITLQCARCHEHKYDPFSQAEYYRLFAYFNNIDEAGVYSYFTPAVPTPTLLLADTETKDRVAHAENEIAQAQQALTALGQSRLSHFEQWLKDRPAELRIPGQVAYLDFEDFQSDANKSIPGKLGKGVLLTGDDAVDLEVGNFTRDAPFTVALWINTPDLKERAVVFHRSRAWTDAGSRGYQLLIEQGKLSASLIHFWPGNALRVRTRDTIPPGKWVHAAVTYDGSSRAGGVTIFVDGKPAQLDVVRDNLYKNITGGGGDNISIGARFRDRGFTNGMVDEFRVFDRQLTALEIEQLHGASSLSQTLAVPAAQLTPRQRAALFEYYLATVDTEYAKALSALRAARKRRGKTVDPVAEIMVMRELQPSRPTFLLRRGAYDAPTQRVAPGTPAVLPPQPPGAPANRLGLARWLTDPQHPLLARVTVNRFWQLCFGRGLVGTPEDFGSQGEVPTHPELLDWLARDFIDHGWDVKRLFKQMVTSATYQQQSVASPSLLARDPQNLLLARAPRYRLSAEMIRDNALAVSGLLVQKIGGPPVRPYELAASFKPIKPDEGDGLYRRSLYTFWKRTAPAPVMMTLDASKRDVCAVKRERTASPLQAFVMLNGPQFVEAARVLGERLLQKHGDDEQALVDEMFRLLTSRRPSQQERAVLLDLLHEQRTYFEADPARGEEFLQNGAAPRGTAPAAPRLAAAGVLALGLMNFDECVTKR